jgi:hypothetical protein
MGLSDLLIYDGTTPITLILWAMYIGVAIAIIASYIIRDKYGKFINKLIEIEANTPEKAVKLDEIDIKGKWFIKFALKNHLNYKDSLVAITGDGKFYANYRYTDEPPSIKTFKAITRNKKSRVRSRIKESAPEEAQIEATAFETEIAEVTAAEETAAQETSATENYEYTRQRVNFSPSNARFYLPSEVHDKVKGIYGDSKTKFWVVLLGLIGGAIIAYFGVPVIEQILRMWSEI